MKILSSPPYHVDHRVREVLVEMALGATLTAEEDFIEYHAGRRPCLYGDYIWEDADGGFRRVYARTVGGYVQVGIWSAVTGLLAFLVEVPDYQYPAPPLKFTCQRCLRGCDEGSSSEVSEGRLCEECKDESFEDTAWVQCGVKIKGE